MTSSGSIESSAVAAARSPTMTAIAAVGMLAHGVVHVIVGVIALSIAWGGGSSEEASPTGAFATLSDQPLGIGLLWIVAVGMVGLAVWQVGEAILGQPGAEGLEQLGHRVGAIGKAAAYLVLGFLAGREALGDGSSSGQGGQSEEEGLTARLLGAPAGPLLVGAIGVGIVAIALYLVHRARPSGSSTSWRVGRRGGRAPRPDRVRRQGDRVRDRRGPRRHRGGAPDPEESGGLDEALTKLRDQPYGQWLLTAVAVGLIAYGLYAFARRGRCRPVGAVSRDERSGRRDGSAVTIHPEHPFLPAADERDPVRRLRARLVAPVTIWAASTDGSRTGACRAPGFTVGSTTVADGAPSCVLGADRSGGRAVDGHAAVRRFTVNLLQWADRNLADVFAGLAPAPAGGSATGGWQDTAYGPALAGGRGRDAGWSRADRRVRPAGDRRDRGGRGGPATRRTPPRAGEGPADALARLRGRYTRCPRRGGDPRLRPLQTDRHNGRMRLDHLSYACGPEGLTATVARLGDAARRADRAGRRPPAVRHHERDRTARRRHLPRGGRRARAPGR